MVECPNLNIGADLPVLDTRLAINLMAVFAAIGWAVASIVYHLPVSSSTRAAASSIRDHALFAMVLAGTGSAIGELTRYALDQAVSYINVEKALDPKIMYDFNRGSATIAGTILAFFAGAMAIGPAIPVIGTIISFVVGVIYAPAVAILGTLMVMAAMNTAGYFILANSMMIIFPIGLALYAAPGKIAKGLGAFLISLTLVSYIVLPIAPYIVASLMSVTAGGGVNPNELTKLLGDICRRASPNPGIDEFLGLINPRQWYGDLVKWLTSVAASSFLLALILAAARALSHSLGGVSANL
jgi:hypothetical protein